MKFGHSANKRIIGSVLLAACVIAGYCPVVVAESKAESEVRQAKDLIQQKKYDESIPLLDSAIKDDAQLKSAYLLRGESKEHLKKYEQAIDDYSKYILLVPTDPEVYQRMSKVNADTGKTNTAVSYLSKALVMKPKDGQLYADRADLYDKLGEKNLASIDREVARKLGVKVVASSATAVSKSTKVVVKHNVARSAVAQHSAVHAKSAVTKASGSK